MAAVEPKGGATVDQEPMPDSDLPPGGGYVLRPPDENGRWEVSTYKWDPGVIIVNEGDIVTLEIVGIHGKEHTIMIEEHDVQDIVTRGHVTRVTFTAGQVGIFKIVCDIHLPSMQADLVVLASE
ncbi:MAG TPA: cupredoxin domain-containing protein [Thermomicrobiales bacterium]|nr:cupredoxin domain-containing protein [Thermomicrobiales bacterium]